jgi:hypothetical protein
MFLPSLNSIRVCKELVFVWEAEIRGSVTGYPRKKFSSSHFIQRLEASVTPTTNRGIHTNRRIKMQTSSGLKQEPISKITTHTHTHTRALTHAYTHTHRLAE